MSRVPTKPLDRLAGAATKALLAVTLVFLLIPGALIAVLSFSNDAGITFPPESWGIERYTSVFTSGRWNNPAALSFELAAWTVGVALIIVIPAVFALGRSKVPGKSAVTAIAVAPLIIPISAYAVGMYAVFAQFDLLGTRGGVVLSHALHVMPLVFIVLITSMGQIKPELEYAAMSMGSTRTQAWRKVTLPLLFPAIVAAAIFAFVGSFDEAVFITFLGGAGLNTLPKTIFDSVQYGVDPAITAVATLMMALTTLLMFLAFVLRKGPKNK